MTWITEHWMEIGATAVAAYTLALHIVALTPTKADDDVVDRIANVLRNFGILPPKA